MAKTSPYDPQLHLLRSCAKTAQGRGAKEIESARFGLWRSIDERDAVAARQWLRALEVAVRTYLTEQPAHQQAALEAIAEIREGLSRK